MMARRAAGVARPTRRVRPAHRAPRRGGEAARAVRREENRAFGGCPGEGRPGEGRPGEGRGRVRLRAPFAANPRTRVLFESLRRRSGTRGESASPNAERIVSGIKNVVVTPLSHEECTQLKAADALNNRRGYVAKKSDDQLAYIYLEDMEQMGEGASTRSTTSPRSLPRHSQSRFDHRRAPQRGREHRHLDSRAVTKSGVDVQHATFWTRRHHHAIRVPRQSRRVGG